MTKIYTKCSICGKAVVVDKNLDGVYGIKCAECRTKIASRLGDLKATKEGLYDCNANFKNN